MLLGISRRLPEYQWFRYISWDIDLYVAWYLSQITGVPMVSLYFLGCRPVCCLVSLVDYLSTNGFVIFLEMEVAQGLTKIKSLETWKL